MLNNSQFQPDGKLRGIQFTYMKQLEAVKRMIHDAVIVKRKIAWWDSVIVLDKSVMVIIMLTKN